MLGTTSFTNGSSRGTENVRMRRGSFALSGSPDVRGGVRGNGGGLIWAGERLLQRCYSTTDMFAAGFKDHGIGKILGVDNDTGAGGANVETDPMRGRFAQLRGHWANCEIETATES